MYIRYFATTDPQSPVSKVALEYLKSLIRIAPVRVIDPARMMPGIPDGEWARYAGLFATPMIGPMINVVCTEPSRWTWMHKIAAPKENKAGSKTEEISGRLELYTAGVRNVLFTHGRENTPELAVPSEGPLYETARKYEAVVLDQDYAYTASIPVLKSIHCVPVPVKDHAAIRTAVLGPSL